MKVKPIYIIFTVFIIALLYNQVRSSMLGDLLVPTMEGLSNESFYDLIISKVVYISAGAILTMLLVFNLIKFTIKLLLNSIEK